MEVYIHQAPEKFYDGYEEYRLTFGMVNNSAKTLNEYRIDVEVPNAFISQSTSFNAEVESNRTPDRRLFRAENKDRPVTILRPGDKQPAFFILTLVVSPGMKETDAMNEKIIVKVFAGDTMTQKIQTTVKDLLAMPLGFG